MVAVYHLFYILTVAAAAVLLSTTTQHVTAKTNRHAKLQQFPHHQQQLQPAAHAAAAHHATLLTKEHQHATVGHQAGAGLIQEKENMKAFVSWDFAVELDYNVQIVNPGWFSNEDVKMRVLLKAPTPGQEKGAPREKLIPSVDNSDWDEHTPVILIFHKKSGKLLYMFMMPPSSKELGIAANYESGWFSSGSTQVGYIIHGLYKFVLNDAGTRLIPFAPKNLWLPYSLKLKNIKNPAGVDIAPLSKFKNDIMSVYKKMAPLKFVEFMAPYIVRIVSETPSPLEKVFPDDPLKLFSHPNSLAHKLALFFCSQFRLQPEQPTLEEKAIELFVWSAHFKQVRFKRFPKLRFGMGAAFEELKTFTLEVISLMSELDSQEQPVFDQDAKDALQDKLDKASMSPEAVNEEGAAVERPEAEMIPLEDFDTEIASALELEAGERPPWFQHLVFLEASDLYVPEIMLKIDAYAEHAYGRVVNEVKEYPMELTRSAINFLRKNYLGVQYDRLRAYPQALPESLWLEVIKTSSLQSTFEAVLAQFQQEHPTATEGDVVGMWWEKGDGKGAFLEIDSQIEESHP